MKEEVYHERYGKGAVVSKRYQGKEKLVSFPNGLTTWIRSIDLKYTNQESYNPSSNQSEHIISGIDSISSKNNKNDLEYPEKIQNNNINDFCSTEYLSETGESFLENIIKNLQFKREVQDFQLNTNKNIEYSSTKLIDKYDARSIVEALRLGGVPRNKIDSFTTGRETDISFINNWCSSSNQSCLILDGEYGVGKSHILELTEDEALHNGWAVSRIEIDPQEVPFNKPKQLYKKIIEDLKYLDNQEQCNFQDMLLKLTFSLGTSKSQLLQKHPFFGNFLRYWGNLEFDNESTIEWISAKNDSTSRYYPKMPNTQISSNVYCNLLNTIAWIAKEILGLKGLLILIDEAESLDPSFYTTYQNSMGFNTVIGLIMTSNCNPSLVFDCKKDDNIIRINGRYQGVFSDLFYSGGNPKKMPYIWREDSVLKVVYSFIPTFFDTLQDNPNISEYLQDLPRINIVSITDDEYKSLLQKIIYIYNIAYDFDPPISLVNFFQNFPKEKTRIFVKSIVELLDIIRHDPTVDIQNLLSDY